jgi:xanthine dehydrogenase accessory factor
MTSSHAVTDAATMAVADDALFSLADAWQADGHRLVFAIVIRTWGSSPRQIGSLMLVRDDQMIAGSVSGGCVEGAVVDAALKMMADAGCQQLDFGVADADAWEVGLSCGGAISVWLVSVADGYFDPKTLHHAASAMARRETVMLDFDLATGRVQMAAPVASTSCLEGTVFTLFQPPRPQLIIIGAVHISQHLAPMAAQLSFDVTVIDPRRLFATENRFPGVKMQDCWPDEALAQMVLDEDTALVTLTHDPKIDDAALHLGLAKPLFYVACLGSRKTHAARLQRLAAAGFDAAITGRIHGPAGLDIGAKTPAEIAVSVLAELIANYHQRQGIAHAAG